MFLIIFSQNALAIALNFAIPSGYGNIRYSRNFPSDKASSLLETLGFMQSTNTNSYSFITSPTGVSVSPYTHLTTNIYLINYVGNRPGTYAYTTQYKDINLHDSSPWFSRAVMASVLLHEADHQRYGSHTCGAGDVNIDSTTGVGILYGAKIYYNSTLDAYEKAQIYYDTTWRISNLLCNNQGSMAIGSKAIYSNSFPVKHVIIRPSPSCRKFPENCIEP